MIDKDQLEQTLAMINTSAYKALHGVPKGVFFDLRYDYHDIVSLFIYYNNKRSVEVFMTTRIDYIVDRIIKIDYNKYKG